MTAPAELARLGLVLDSDGFVRSAAAASKAMENLGRTVDGAGNRSITSLDGIIGRLKQMGGVLGLALGVNQLISYTNAWTDLNARLKQSTGSSEAGAEAMERLAAMARRTYSDVRSTTESWLASQATLKGLGLTMNQTLDYTEALNNAMVVSGAKAERAASVQRALSTAMALGVLRGDQLNTVIGAGGRIAEILAKELGTNVTKLREVGSEGKITGDIIQKALIGNLETLRKEADAMPATIGDAFVLLQNSVLKTIGGFDGMTRTSFLLSKALVLVADNLAPLLAGAGVLALAAATAKLIPIFSAVTLAFSVFATGVASGAGVMTSALAVTSGGFYKLLAAMNANPWIAAATAILAVGTALGVWLYASMKAEKQATKEAEAQRELTKEYERQALVSNQRVFNELAVAKAREEAFRRGGPAAVERFNRVQAQSNLIIERATAQWQEYGKANKDAEGATVSFEEAIKAGNRTATGFLLSQSAVVQETDRLSRSLDANVAAWTTNANAVREANQRLDEALRYQQEMFPRTRQNLLDEIALNRLRLTGRWAEAEALEKEARIKARIAEATRGIYDVDMKAEIERRVRATERQNEALVRQYEIEQRSLQAAAQLGAERAAREKAADRAREETRAAELALAGERERQLKQPWENAMRSIQSTFASTIEVMLTKGIKGWQGFGKALVQIFNQATAQIAAMLIQRGIIQLLGSFLTAAPAGTSSVRTGVDIGNQIPTGFGVAHSGGVVGASSFVQRSVPASTFLGAPRYHAGGPVLGADEVPIIAQRGETIIPRGQSAGASTTVQVRQNINFNVAAMDTAGADAVLRRSAPTIAKIVSEAAAQSPSYQSRLSGRRR